MPRAGDQVLGDRGSAPARGIGRVAVAAGGQLRVRVTKSPEPSHPRLSPARMIGARTPSGGPAQCRQHVQRGAATAGRHRRRSATAANLIRAQHMVRGCQAAAMAPPDRAAGRLTPLCGRRKEPHPTISPSGPFLFDIHGKRGHIGMCSQPAPHICIVASQLRRVRVTYNKLTLMPPPNPCTQTFSNRETTNRSGWSPPTRPRARRRLQHRGSGRLRPHRSWIAAPQLTVTEPTDVAGQPHSLLGRPPPRVAS